MLFTTHLAKHAGTNSISSSSSAFAVHKSSRKRGKDLLALLRKHEEEAIEKQKAKFSKMTKIILDRFSYDDTIESFRSLIDIEVEARGYVEKHVSAILFQKTVNDGWLIGDAEVPKNTERYEALVYYNRYEEIRDAVKDALVERFGFEVDCSPYNCTIWFKVAE